MSRCMLSFGRIPVVLFFIGLILVDGAFAESRGERFRRLLQLYVDPTYAVSHRAVGVEGSYHSESTDEDLASQLDNTALSDVDETLDRSANLDIFLSRARLRGDTNFSGSSGYRISLNGGYLKEIDKRENSALGKADYSSHRAWNGSFIMSLDTAKDRYLRRSLHPKHPPFKDIFLNYGLGGDIFANGFESVDENQSNLTSLSDQKKRYYTVNLKAKLRPSVSVGKGRIIPVEALYRAIEIERVLKDRGVIAGMLGDGKIIEIARWYEKRNLYDVKYDDPEKFLYAGLDTVLFADSVSFAMRPVAWDYFRMKEVVRYREGMTIPRGVRISIDMSGWMSLDARLFSWYQDWGGGSTPVDDRHWNIGFDNAGTLRLNLVSGIAFSDRSFLQAQAAFITMYAGKAYENAGEFGSLDATALYRFLFSNRFYFETGFSDFRVKEWYKPEGLPSRIYGELDYYIADKVRIQLTGERLESESYYTDWDDDYSLHKHKSRSTRTERVVLGVQYDF